MDSFESRSTLALSSGSVKYASLPQAEKNGLSGVSTLPVAHKVLLENLLRNEDGTTITAEDIRVFRDLSKGEHVSKEVAFRPARVLMQDFTGVPAVADLASMREAAIGSGHSGDIINPISPVDLVIDHSVMVDRFASQSAFEENVEIEMVRNAERYKFLRWGQQAFENFRVVPPGTGICHQVNLEYLANVVWTRNDTDTLAYPDTVVGTDSHTTMINGLGVLGWGVGGIEAEAAMLGQPISMLIPEVVGFRMTGELNDGITATDLVLRVVEILRQHGVVGKFVEFFGPALDSLPLADRATIANMAPEYGATCGFFPVDDETLKYLRLTGRSGDLVELVERYTKSQGMWRETDHEPEIANVIELDLTSIEPSLAGPKRPQDRVPLSQVPEAFGKALANEGGSQVSTQIDNDGISHGSVVIAAITSCTNTSNPAVMIGAGLVAKKANALGIKPKPWVKTSFAPGSKVVTEYLVRTGLQAELDAIGFNLVGYGCTTCIGNSGPLPEDVSTAITTGDLVVASVLSGNRNFEGRVHQEVKTNWLASPPLVVAYALAGSTIVNLATDPIAESADGNSVFLSDLWPSRTEIDDAIAAIDADMFKGEYADVFTGTKAWSDVPVEAAATYDWENSTYIKQPPFFSLVASEQEDRTVEVDDARILAILGDSVTTDHISPAGAIQPSSPAGEYLQQNGVQVTDFNSYGSRRGNHEVMMRGTFANIRIQNEMVPSTVGGVTRHIPTGDQISIYDAAVRYRGVDTALVVFAGKEYGTGSSRDWAAKGTRLLGINAVIAESFERIHRSNLVGMGVLPLEFTEGESRKLLELKGDETIKISFLNEAEIQPGQDLQLTIGRADGTTHTTILRSRIDTANEVEYFKCGGILQYVLSNLTAAAA